MVRENGSIIIPNLLACDLRDLRNFVKCVSATKTNPTVDQLADLLLSAFPQPFCSRVLLTARLRNITQLHLHLRRDEEPTSLTKKRRKIDEVRQSSAENEVLSSSASASSSGSDDELEPDGGETDNDGDNARRDAVGNKGPISRDLAAKDDLGGGTREVNKKVDDRLKDVSGKIWPMLGDLYGKDRDGDDDTYEDVKREVTLSLHHLKLLRHLGTRPLAGILLHGPQGCGKTTWAQAIVNESGVPCFVASAAALVSGAPDHSIQGLFFTAHRSAPSIVLIEGIKPSIVNQLMSCMMEPYRFIKPVNHDADSGSSKSIPGHVLVIGTTNCPGALDPAFRRCFREIGIVNPDEEARLKILSHLTSKLKLKAGFDLKKIAQCTLGFIAGDLAKLVEEAIKLALERIMNGRIFNSEREGVQFENHRQNCYRQPFSEEELENLSITIDHFVEAGKMITPSSKPSLFSTTRNAKWDDVGGLLLLKSKFEHHILKPIQFPEVYKGLGLCLHCPFLLYGPPGCGKTFIVEALANEAGVNFMHIKVPELLIYGNEAGLVVHIILNYAAAHTPCILFFDEFDVMNEEGGRWQDYRQIFPEIMGREELYDDVYIIGATNKSEIVNHLPCLPELFDEIHYVPLPSPEERGAILKALARDKPIQSDVDLMALGKDVACHNFNAADLEALMKEAALAAIDRPMMFDKGCSRPLTIENADFKSALAKVSTSASRSQRKNYGPSYLGC